MSDLASALTSQFGDGEPRQIVAVDPGKFTIRAYRYAGGWSELDPLRAFLCDPCSAALEGSLHAERESLSDAAKRELALRRKARKELREEVRR